jgi:hypothetical protein
MKPLYHAFIAGFIVAFVNLVILKAGLTFWEASTLTTAGLIAGIFFILAMIFQAALRDYKETDIHISGLRGTTLALNDLSTMVALRTEGVYHPRPFGEYLAQTVQTIKRYIENKANYDEAQQALFENCQASQPLQPHLTPDEASLYLQQIERLRVHLSFMAYSKSLRFPAVGYFFLYFFICILVGMHLFANASSTPLALLYIFTLTSTLVFFAEFIRDLDKIFDRAYTSFSADTLPLQNCIRSIKKHLEEFEK